VPTAAPLASNVVAVPTAVATAKPTDIPPSAAKLTKQAQSLLDRGATAKAIDVARQATELDPSNSEAWLTLGAALDTKGSTKEARAAYKTCVDQGKGASVRECRAMLSN